jgi:hypothetical protein
MQKCNFEAEAKNWALLAWKGDVERLVEGDWPGLALNLWIHLRVCFVFCSISPLIRTLPLPL